MSDTPRTDELAKREFITDGVWIRHARELERENAALRAENHLLRMKSGINVGQMYGVADATSARKEAQL